MKKFFLILTLGLAACMGLTSYPAAAYAATETDATSLDGTSVEEDLQGVIDPAKYPADPEGEVRLVQEMGLAEYCYSLNEELAADYGVYVYVYNPAQLSIRTSDVSNVVNMATSFADDGEAMGYQNIALTFLDASDDGLFYKFKIQPARTVLKMEQSLAAKNGGKRIYNIAGIQLWEAGAKNPTDYHVDTIFTCTGFARGCGSDPAEESTLDIRMSGLTTLDLPLSHTNTAGEVVQNDTYYRTGYSSLGDTHQWQINSVYFSIDRELDDSYKKLKQIRATWYEYQLSPMLLTMNEELYNSYLWHLGEDIGGLNHSELKERFHYGIGKYDRWSDLGSEFDHCYWNGWTYALPETRYPGDNIAVDQVLNEGGTPINKLAFLFKTQIAGWNKITTEELTDYIVSYSAAHPGAASDPYLAEKGYSEDLFTNGTAVHADGKAAVRGKNTFDFDADEKIDLRSYNSTLGGWKKFFMTLFGADIGEEWQINDMAPIQKVEAKDLINPRDAEIANALYINETDVNEFKTWAKAEMNAGKAVYLFRFAVTDYEQQTMFLQNLYTDFGAAGSSGVPMKDGYGSTMAQEAIFLGFEIIHLGYMSGDGSIHIIPVVESPIDIIPDMDIYVGPKKPDGNWMWWCIIAGAIVIVLMIADGILENKAGGTIL